MKTQVQIKTLRSPFVNVHFVFVHDGSLAEVYFGAKGNDTGLLAATEHAQSLRPDQITYKSLGGLEK